NNLDGTIPECLGNLSSSLLEIDLGDNNFHGQIPEKLKVVYLNLLDVGNNNLNDTFPNWLGNLDRLHVLIFRSNRFYGEVGSFDVTVSLIRLRIIDLSCNNFSGYLLTNIFEHLHAIREGYGKKVEPGYMKDVLGKKTLNYAFGLSIETIFL
ncbi:hypothetical protein Gotur_027519, partial [Gossypium turneri]